MRGLAFACALSLAACSSPKSSYDTLCRIAREVEADGSIPEAKKLERLDARVMKEVTHKGLIGTWEALRHVGPEQKMTILKMSATELGYSNFKCAALEARLAKPIVWKEEDPPAKPRQPGVKPVGKMTIVRVEGGVTGTEAVTRAISKDGPAMKACYQKRLDATGEVFEGNLTYRETAGDGGMVTFEVENDLLSDPETRACVTEITRGWKIATASKREDEMVFELQFRAPE